MANPKAASVRSVEETEASVIRKCLRSAKAAGAYHIRLTLRAGPSRGVPDHVFLGNGHVVFVEFKRPGGRPSAIQRYVFDKIVARGVPVYVVTSLEEFAIAMKYEGIWT